jgi:DNA-directed RNA polymerase specialized sigma24 family protein
MANLSADWRTCAADLFENNYGEVLSRLTCRNPKIDREDLHDAFVQAVLDIAAAPDKFDGDRSTSITDFLAGAAQRALLPILRTHRRRLAREEKKGLSVATAVTEAREEIDELANCELANQARQVARDDEERNVLELWGLGHSDAEISEKIKRPLADVRRIRDRVTQRLRRKKQHSRDEDEI